MGGCTARARLPGVSSKLVCFKASFQANKNETKGKGVFSWPAGLAPTQTGQELESRGKSTRRSWLRTPTPGAVPRRDRAPRRVEAARCGVDRPTPYPQSNSAIVRPRVPSRLEKTRSHRRSKQPMPIPQGNTNRILTNEPSPRPRAHLKISRQRNNTTRRANPIRIDAATAGNVREDAALPVRSPMTLTPLRKRVKRRPQVQPTRSQRVFVPTRPVRGADEDTGLDQRHQPLGQHRARHVQVRLQLAEPAHPEETVPQHQHRPAFADDLQRAGQ